MFSVVKKLLIIVLISSVELLNAIPCSSIKNQECKVREVITNNEYMTYPYIIKVNRCNGNCNNITNPYSRVCIPDIIKNVIVKIFDLISLKNRKKTDKWHERCKCVCRLDPIICNNKQKWNKDKCICECLVDRKCGNKFIWNPSNCKCEYKNVKK